MFGVEMLTAIAVGLFVGVLHAFDADHVIAMSSYANTSRKMSHILRYACKWGLGHGGVLLFLSTVLVLVGFQLPSWFVHYSEMAVGLLLIYLGLRLLMLVVRQTKDLHRSRIVQHDHTPLFIGMLHGVAGSAPMLALLPNMLKSQFLQHVAWFSLGCMLGMFSFGFMFAVVQTKYIQRNVNLAKGFTSVLATLSVGFGGYWLMSS
ncbi:hypothetical protein [Catenovulum agarivorans]|uniref:hypothetical protein n=1 Tax=Catenovulum agarivorans TaxID=1172192 RepID=UPI00031E0AF5|nr:hypothetical protein [Catenovulum agarivorans]